MNLKSVIGKEVTETRIRQQGGLAGQFCGLDMVDTVSVQTRLQSVHVFVLICLLGSGMHLCWTEEPHRLGLAYQRLLVPLPVLVRYRGEKQGVQDRG